MEGVSWPSTTSASIHFCIVHLFSHSFHMPEPPEHSFSYLHPDTLSSHLVGQIPGYGLFSRLLRQAARPQVIVFFLRSCRDSRILTFFGHITRREDTSVERLVVQGKVEGTRARGRSPMRWTDQIKSALNGPLHECTRKATVREEWRRIVCHHPCHEDHDHSAKSVTTEKK
ncbi:hypothetical protein K1T71_011663 [Dendrolimus kikuchii]|uniref:Uncharacterized protein n=1 Tax=Dendrolimus kikuchii TaxID=765133 RepID=A0ACC1CM71_9NEOP|nr:hypothetical protein K1T71_011663 [Dendrolimus kikuchii]